MKKYKVTRETFAAVIEHYGDMSIDELKVFLKQFIGERSIQERHAFKNQSVLDEEIEYIQTVEKRMWPMDRPYHLVIHEIKKMLEYDITKEECLISLSNLEQVTDGDCKNDVSIMEKLITEHFKLIDEYRLCKQELDNHKQNNSSLK